MDSVKRSELIAGVYEMSQRRVQQLYKQYLDTGEVFSFAKMWKEKTGNN